jgi:hypothetical protein
MKDRLEYSIIRPDPFRDFAIPIFPSVNEHANNLILSSPVYVNGPSMLCSPIKKENRNFELGKKPSPKAEVQEHEPLGLK